MVLIVVAAGALLLIPTHLSHANRFGGWFFQFRQGLPFVLLLIVGLAYLLLAGPRLLRVVTYIALVVSIRASALDVRDDIWSRDAFHPPTASQVEFARWIAGRQAPPLFASN